MIRRLDSGLLWGPGISGERVVVFSAADDAHPRTKLASWTFSCMYGNMSSSAAELVCPVSHGHATGTVCIRIACHVHFGRSKIKWHHSRGKIQAHGASELDHSPCALGTR